MWETAEDVEALQSALDRSRFGALDWPEDQIYIRVDAHTMFAVARASER
jgi:hypothetical protein